MNELKGETISLGKLFSAEFFFRVPEYQRPFSWEDDNFDDLINDLLSADKTQEYFLGTLVLQRKEGNNHDVVDGQQRLTSLNILLACIRDRVEKANFKDAVHDKILQKENVADGIPEKVRIEVKDRQIFHEIVITKGGTIGQKNEKGIPEPEWRYLRAVNIFQEKLNKIGQKELEELIQFISQKCVVIYLSTSTFDDAFKLFTIVNDRGKQLRRIDILKSVNIAPEIVASEAVRNRIAQEWEELEKDVGEATFENILHLIRLIVLKDKPQGDLLKEFENRIFRKGLIVKGEKFIDLVFSYVEQYKTIFDDKILHSDEPVKANKFRALIHIMNTEFKASEWRACLLFFANKFEGKLLFEFTLLLEKVYLAQWVKGTRKDERYADYSKLLFLIENAKNESEVLKSIQYDEDSVKAACDNVNIYGAGYCKYFLLRLELIASEHDVAKEFFAKSIEHVLPQTPKAGSDWEKMHDMKEIKDYVNTIGNLVLLSKGKNSAAKNYDFKAKKDKYLKSRVTDYPRSVQVLGYDVWDKDTISKRTQEVKNTILANF